MARHPSFRSTLRGAAALAGLSACLLAHAAVAGEVTVPVDEVKMMKFPKPVTTVFIANPLIADITVVDATKVFLLGKSFGTTNLIALDKDGNQMFEDQVTVLGREGSTVTVHHGKNQVTLACIGERCEVSPTPGDQTESFDAVSDQISKHQDAPLKAAAIDAVKDGGDGANGGGNAPR
jgi:hypothetical protein